MMKLPIRKEILLRSLEVLWLLCIAGFAILHAFNLRADFPNGTPWHVDWAKYTDEGWYGNAAVRWHLTGHWYVPGDFNPAPAVPVWPFLEWLLFFFTGVKIEAARGLAVGFFFLNLLLGYFVMRKGAPRWAAMLGLTMVVTSPFLYSFSRLAILEPMLTAMLLGIVLFALKLHDVKHPNRWAAAIGLLLTLMLLTKTTTIFILPAVAWVVVQPLWPEWKLAVRYLMVAAATMAASFGLWMGFIVSRNLLADYRHFFFINNYVKPPEFYWPILSFWWSFHGGLWMDVILVPLAGVLLLIAAFFMRAKKLEHVSAADWAGENWARKWIANPMTGVSVLVAAGYVAFMTIQNHPQPRYFALVAYFCFFLVAEGLAVMLEAGGKVRAWGWLGMGVAVAAIAMNGAETLRFARHPEYTYVNAAQALTQYIDAHPNGNRILVSISGDEISMMTHIPSLCDDFGTQDLAGKLARYQPGWYAAWNDLDPGTLEDIHTHFSLEQVATFPALDDDERNLLVLFKLHPLPGGRTREPNGLDLQQPLDEDKILVPVE
jgi:hypothetical protein